MPQHPRMPSEVLIQLHLNGRFFSRILCSPVDVRQLIVGWLFTHRLIENTDEIHALGVCEDLNEVRVENDFRVLRRGSGIAGLPRPDPQSNIVGVRGYVSNPGVYVGDVCPLKGGLSDGRHALCVFDSY